MLFYKPIVNISPLWLPRCDVRVRPEPFCIAARLSTISEWGLTTMRQPPCPGLSSDFTALIFLCSKKNVFTVMECITLT